jgi:lysophospholipase L1-like esterase
MTWQRYVAIGDSQTEGLHDYDEAGRLRGWADRFAERLAGRSPELLYANLAVRGKRAAEVRAEQLEPALALAPDLATVVAGVNDILMPNADAAVVVADIEAMYAALADAGCMVMGCTFPLPSVGLARRLRPRLRVLNAAIREAAARRGVLIVDAEGVAMASDLRLWSPDRVHLNPHGHERLAAAFDGTLTASSDEIWLEPLPAAPPKTRGRVLAEETAWIVRFMLPKIVRTIRGRSSGDGCTAKRPSLIPVRARR